MAQYGNVILKYRRLNNLTQSQLAEKLFVSPQAVSKWEKNQSEPDLATIKRLADIFEITVDQFFAEEKDSKEVLEEVDEKAEEQVSCEICKQSFNEEDIVSNNPYNICSGCNHELKEEEQFFIDYDATKPKKIEVGKLKGKISFIVGGVIGIGFFLLFLITGLVSNDLEFIEGLLSGVIFGVFSSTFTTQMFYDSWLRDFFGNFIGYSLNMPGLIFELSIDGIIWLITVKLIFGLIVFLFSVLVFLFGLSLTILISPISYIYELVRKLKEGFDND